MKNMDDKLILKNRLKETLTYMDFPAQHWTRIQTHNAIERLNREIILPRMLHKQSAE